MIPTLNYEREFWKQGFASIAGIDEVGRGALAGPLVVAAVVFPQMSKRPPSLALIRDSKLLPAKARETAAEQIKATAISWSCAQSTVAEINRVGIAKATQMAMRRAIKALPQVDFVLIDFFYIPYLPGLRRQKQLAIKNGDRRCLTIAAASILAKVYRDQLMTRLGKRHPAFGFEKNKGYGTQAHRNAISLHGPRHFHRKAFVSGLF